jgi:hypothetical protein
MQIAGPAAIYSTTLQRVMLCKSDDELNSILTDYQKQILTKQPKVDTNNNNNNNANNNKNNNNSAPKPAPAGDGQGKNQGHREDHKKSSTCVII